MRNLSIEELKLMRDLQENVENHAMAQALDELIAIRELKADQVPAGWRFEDCENEPCTNGAVVSVGTGSDNIHLCAECSRNDKYKRQRTVALSQRLSLKVTAPQKPVVLPVADHETEDGYKYYREETVKAAIEAAGGIVKDGE